MPDESPGSIGHYWGAAAILRRLGYSARSSTSLRRLILRTDLPVYRRHDPKRPQLTPLYTHEGLIRDWELRQAKHYRDSLALAPGRIWRRRTDAEIRIAQRVSAQRATGQRVQRDAACGVELTPDGPKIGSNNQNEPQEA